MSDTVITKENIEERKEALNNDLQNVGERIAEYDKKRSEDIALSHALNGAIQQCNIFLEGFNDEKPEMAGDDGNDESSVDEE
tara:strand:- start:311 stop:556 length:246 start_codon:yes stop_codon:yes gene_type:complete